MTAETYQDSVFTLTSPAFASETTIPPVYTTDGAGTSPPLAWSTVPDGTKSFALIAHDPDAPVGDITHWILYDIPADIAGLDAGYGRRLPGGTLQGVNSKGSLGWTPPSPPPGNPPHRYIFKFYALDCPTLGLPEGATREQIEDAAAPHTLSNASLVGMYGR